MSPPETSALIATYLEAPFSTGGTISESLAHDPDESFAAIFGFRGPYPNSMDPRDAHGIYLVNLLADLLLQCPRLFTECDLKTVSRSHRYSLLNAAISTQDVRFVDGILGGLKDRSIYVKQLVVDAISRYDHLRTSEAKVELERLLKVKSIAESDYDRRPIESALDLFPPEP